MVSQETALNLIAARKPDHALDRLLYTDPGTLALDLAAIWYQDWLFAIPSCEIPKTGNFVTLQVGDYPVLIVRGADGQIRAFHNSCRHRGSRVCTALKGNAPKLVCPYHQWSYTLSGDLQGDRQELVLIPVDMRVQECENLLSRHARLLSLVGPRYTVACSDAFGSRLLRQRYRNQAKSATVSSLPQSFLTILSTRGMRSSAAQPARPVWATSRPAVLPSINAGTKQELYIEPILGIQRGACGPCGS